MSVSRSLERQWLTRNSPVYLHTVYAWYMLRIPADRYREDYFAWYRPHRTAQMIISRSQDYPRGTYQDFKAQFEGSYDVLLQGSLREEFLRDAVRFITVNHWLSAQLLSGTYCLPGARD